MVQFTMARDLTRKPTRLFRLPKWWRKAGLQKYLMVICSAIRIPLMVTPFTDKTSNASVRLIQKQLHLQLLRSVPMRARSASVMALFSMVENSAHLMELSWISLKWKKAPIHPELLKDQLVAIIWSLAIQLTDKRNNVSVRNLLNKKWKDAPYKMKLAPVRVEICSIALLR